MSKPISSSTTSVKTNLRQPVDFVGRERELEAVLNALGPATRAWIISLTGVGGIGKTELAIKAAHMAAQKKLFNYIIWTTAKDSWLTHEGIQYLKTQLSVDDLLNTIIEVLEMDPRLYKTSPERKKEQVEAALRSASCLLIVDNLETVQDQAVIQFLKELPGSSKALVTTRFGGLKAPN